MKITKYPQSCILIESKKVKLLIDPSSVQYNETFLKEWKKAAAVLVTHKHSDHINATVLKNITAPIYSTKEVAKTYPDLTITVIKQKETFTIGHLQIEVVKAVHGFILAEGEVKENVGFIITDGTTKLYITSDTVRFNNNYKADILFANVTSFEASMGLWGVAQTAKDVGAKLLIVAHQEGGRMFYKPEEIEQYLSQQKINFVIPKVLDVINVKQ